jgi:hypothetical protein
VKAAFLKITEHMCLHAAALSGAMIGATLRTRAVDRGRVASIIKPAAIGGGCYRLPAFWGARDSGKPSAHYSCAHTHST